MNNKPIINKSLWVVSIFTMALLVLAACQPGGPIQSNYGKVPVGAEPQGKMPTALPVVPVTGSSEVILNVATDPKLGKILVDGKGMTLYLFTKDTANTSNCSGDCLVKWPPFLSTGTVKAGDGVNKSLIGTAKLADGSDIITYNSMPLYYWIKDTKAGDTLGQGVGSVWYVVSPDGKPVGMEAPAPVKQDEAVMLNMVKDAKLGNILVDDKGMTLYMFTKDGPSASNCKGDCLVKWPPFLAKGEVKAGEGVNQSLIGTAKLDDGTMIVTYNKLPLYYWVNDKKAGDTSGQGVGTVWYVVSPEGNPVGK